MVRFVNFLLVGTSVLNWSPFYIEKGMDQDLNSIQMHHCIAGSLPDGDESNNNYTIMYND